MHLHAATRVPAYWAARCLAWQGVPGRPTCCRGRVVGPAEVGRGRQCGVGIKRRRVVGMGRELSGRPQEREDLEGAGPRPRVLLETGVCHENPEEGLNH